MADSTLRYYFIYNTSFGIVSSHARTMVGSNDSLLLLLLLLVNQSYGQETFELETHVSLASLSR